MSDEWIGVVHTTKPKYEKGASDMTVRGRYLLAMAKKKGRFSYNNSGDEMKRQVEFSQPEMTPYGDGELLDFPNHDAYRQLTFPWGGYKVTESMTVKQKEMNKGDEALINMFQTKSNKLLKRARTGFPGEMYKDGLAAGRDNTIWGFETCLGDDGATVAADIIANPSDIYGGLSTALGNQGGAWSANLSTFPNATAATDYPYGQGDSEYDYLAPKLGNWSSNNWGTGLTDWESNAWRVISTMQTWLMNVAGEPGVPDIFMTNAKMFQEFKNSQEGKQRVNLDRGAHEFGFPGVLNLDGTALYADFDCPANIGYFVKLSAIEIASLLSELFRMEGPDRDPRTGWSYLWGLFFYGQMYVQPKHLGKVKNYA